jgi:AraC-like DNA-binding protein
MSVGDLQDHAEPLSAHRLFQTKEVDVARNVVAQKFCPHDLIPARNHEAFAVAHNHAAGKTLSLNYLRYGCEVTINPGELIDFYLVQIPVRGRATVRNGRKTVAAGCETASILNPTRDTGMTWGQGCEKLLLQIDRDALCQVAEQLVGRALPHPVLFDPEVTLSSPALRAWKRNLLATVEVAGKGVAFGPTAHKHQAFFEERLITGFLLAQPSAVSHMLSGSARQCSSGQVLRARAFMMENLSEPITIAQIAAEADCSIRSLQLGFQSHFNCTPTQYLMRQRLNHAHFLLQTCPPETLVQSIAFDSGFSHLGRFSGAYRGVFGCSPRETLFGNSFA